LYSVGNIPEIMNIEGRIHSEYYQKFDEIIPSDFKIEKRTRQPPENMMNALLSFGNSLMYSTVLSEIYRTQLNPTVSYLHEPLERRFSLALDLSEIFKPIFIDRLIFYLVNKKMITENSFDKELNYCMLNKKGKNTFIKEYDKKLKTTIKHKTLNRKVSYKRLIRLEAYKLKKHIIGIKKYEPFVIWW
ncbi:MAG: type I-B CRISPR-associated endonuclease Cas1b, partial [Methanobacteriaceae archaeon]|nr:type I-B CRISPR-associated endonuclease Cas1b [Methanobacteriaceae archaeon]